MNKNFTPHFILFPCFISPLPCVAVGVHRSECISVSALKPLRRTSVSTVNGRGSQVWIHSLRPTRPREPRTSSSFPRLVFSICKMQCLASSPQCPFPVLILGSLSSPHPKGGATIWKCECPSPFTSTDHWDLAVCPCGTRGDEELVAHSCAVGIFTPPAAQLIWKTDWWFRLRASLWGSGVVPGQQSQGPKDLTQGFWEWLSLSGLSLSVKQPLSHSQSPLVLLCVVIIVMYFPHVIYHI